MLLLLVPLGTAAAAAAAMGFSSTPNLKVQLLLEPRPRIGTTATTPRLVRLRCALSSEPPVVYMYTDSDNPSYLELGVVVSHFNLSLPTFLLMHTKPNKT